jgi:hypothetical protein
MLIAPDYSRLLQIVLLLVGVSGSVLAQCSAEVWLEQETFVQNSPTITLKVMAKWNAPPVPTYKIPCSNFTMLAYCQGTLGNNSYMQMSSGSSNVTVINQIGNGANNGQFSCGQPSGGLVLSSDGTPVLVGKLTITIGSACNSTLNFWIDNCSAYQNSTSFCPFNILTQPPPNGSGLTVNAPKCPVNSTIGGQVKKPVSDCPQVGTFTQGFKDVDIDIVSTTAQPTISCPTTKTVANGTYASCLLPNNTYSVKASKSCANPKLKCITTNDAVQIQKQSKAPLSSTWEPWRFIAADVSGDGSVTAFDASKISAYILSNGTGTNNSGCFTFIPENNMGQILTSNNGQTSMTILSNFNVTISTTNIVNADFIGIVRGDVDGSCYCGEILNLQVPNEGIDVEKRITERNINDNEILVKYGFPKDELLDLVQFEAQIPDGFELHAIESNLPNFSEHNFAIDTESGLVKVIWINEGNNNTKDLSFIRFIAKNNENAEFTDDLFSLNAGASILTPQGIEYSIRVKSSELAERKIELDLYSNQKVFVYDYMGRLVLEKNTEDSNYFTEIQNQLGNGLYIIVENNQTRKIVIQK